MKKIKLLTTGGTIASMKGDSGLAPGLKSGGILRYMQEFSRRFDFSHEDIFSMDSSNIQPEEWQVIAEKIYGCLGEYDGVIVTHGTDTMAYTASALGFMLRNLNTAVVLTGSQIPIDDPHTDARTNLCTAVAAIEHGIKGVVVAFDRKIINGTRAVKVSTMGFDAFHSVNADYMARVYADGLRVRRRYTAAPGTAGKTELQKELCTDVFLLKLIPGTSPRIFDALAGLNYRGIVIEAFGAGGMHYLHRDLLEKLRLLCRAGITVVVCSQCLYERSDLSIYEVGQRILSTGVIPALDMTTEAAVTKLMWVLGRTREREEITRLFAANLAGEITPEQ